MIKRIVRFILGLSLLWFPLFAYAETLHYEDNLNNNSSYNYNVIYNTNIKLETWVINNKIFYTLEYKWVKRYYFFNDIISNSHYNSLYRVFYRDISYEFWDVNNVALQVFLIWNWEVRLSTDIILINKITGYQNVLDSSISLGENKDLFSCINGNYSVFKSTYTNFIYLTQYGACLSSWRVTDYSKDYTSFKYWDVFVRVNISNSILFSNFIGTNITQLNVNIPREYTLDKRVSKFWDKLIISGKAGNKYIEWLFSLKDNNLIEEEKVTNKEYSIFFALWYKDWSWHYLIGNLLKKDLRVIKIEWEEVDRTVDKILWTGKWDTQNNDSDNSWWGNSSPTPPSDWWGDFSYFDFLKPKGTDFNSVNIQEQQRVEENNSNDLFFKCNYQWAVSSIFDVVKIDFTIPFINYRINFQPLSGFACPFTTLIGKQYAFLSIWHSSDFSDAKWILNFHNAYKDTFFNTERSLWDILVIIIIWTIWAIIIFKFTNVN